MRIFPPPFDEAAILTLDGVGEWDTATIGVGRGGEIEMLKTLRFPHSLGLLYSAFTYFCGFRVNSGEYKLMGLAPYGEPKYADLIRTELLDLKADGSFRLNMRHFNFAGGLTMTGRSFDTLFCGPPRTPESTITQREMDIAASIQSVTNEIVLRMARCAKALTGARHPCLAKKCDSMKGALLGPAFSDAEVRAILDAKICCGRTRAGGCCRSSSRCSFLEF